MDGELKDRGLPDGYHSYFEGWFLAYFRTFRLQFELRALSEVRTRAGATSYRIPDVLAIPTDVPFLPTPTVAPTLCIEILSPDDRVSDLEAKIDDYVAMGVGAIWIVDPRRRTMATADGEGIHKTREFCIPGHDARITWCELFAELDVFER